MILRRGPSRIAPPPVDLWPCANAEPLPGTAALAGWLGRTILTLVTRYTSPGDRVLLLEPPASGPLRRARDPYAGLSEAVWTVTRLGRGADTAFSRGPESESGPRPDRPALGAVDHSPASPEADRPHPRTPSGTFDLIVTATHPGTTTWIATTAWDRMLTGSGLLAVVTHSDTVGGRLRDPVPLLVDTLRNTDRRWREHVVILNHETPRTPEQRVPTTPTDEPTYHDLIIFGPRDAQSGPAEESSDG